MRTRRTRVASRVNHVDPRRFTKGMLPHTHVSTILADVVGPKCAARVSALTSRKRLTLAPVRLGWGPEGFAEKYTMPFSPPRLTNANSNPRAPPLRSCRSLFLPVSLVPFLAPLRAHQLCVHPHRVEAEVGIKCCRRGGLASPEPEGVRAQDKDDLIETMNGSRETG